MLLEAHPERAFWEIRASKTKGLWFKKRPKTLFPDASLAATSLDLDEGRGIHSGAVGRGADYGGAAIRGGASLGFAGAVISLLAHSRPVSAGFAFYGAGWSVYSHFVARGVDVTFPKNTPMEIRFGTHDSTAPAPPGNHFISQVAKPDKLF